MKAQSFLLIMIAFAVSVSGQATHNVVDPTFNPNVVANLFGGKIVQDIEVLPDGKILVFGNFSSFNRVPTGRVVRLNADGSLDPTFNTQTVTSSENSSARAKITLQPDGKILLLSGDIVAGGQPPKSLVRLNADGTLDASFNYTLGTFLTYIDVDASGRIVLAGDIGTPIGNRKMIRLNSDGSLDSSFNYTPTDYGFIKAQGNKIIVGRANYRVYRLNENGSEDTSFTPVLTTGLTVNGLIVRPDNKILYASDKIYLVNQNGGLDSSFLPPNAIGNRFRLAPDGKIVVATNSGNAIFRRYLANGPEDPSFTPYQHPSYSYCFSIQADGRIVTGDQANLNSSTIPLNNFIRLTANGTPDTTFNPGGLGFQNILPGSIRAITPLPSGKLLLGGKFDVINGVSRVRLARLNADSTVDASFQVNTTAVGNYFSIVRDIYQIRTQADGKIVVSGWFDYVLGGVTRSNFVRLNSDGSIDETFNLESSVPDFSEIVGAGRNRFVTLSDGKLMVGTSKLNGFGASGPVKLTTAGGIDGPFVSALHPSSANVYIYDVVIQPDGKILVSGAYLGGAMISFVARLNPNGSMDPTFTYSEQPNRLRSLLVQLPNGKILVATHGDGLLVGTVRRLNSDGSPDNSFTSLSIPNGIINALLVLPSGNILVGGKFTVMVNGSESRNLLQLRQDGTVEPTTYNLNADVLTLALDDEGRVLVGGVFTVIGANGANASRSYIARLTNGATRFDYDGDGKSDVSVFRPSENKWYILQSSNSTVVERVFAIAGDVPVPADYDGDGKTDVAIFRPSSGDWWYLSSMTSAQVNVNFGQAGDIPRPSDFDADGKADFIVYRPSNSVWYRHGSTGVVQWTPFGIAEDKPVIGDFDGDCKSDLAVFRPSTGVWWYAASASGGVFRATQWGQTGDVPVPGDFDGDAKTDFAVFRPSDGGWYVLKSSNGSFITTAFGISGDKPIAGDYDGDGKDDIAVFRPSTGIWYLLQSTAGFGGVQWGVATDIPTEGAFLP